jgi:hypothetical protein
MLAIHADIRNKAAGNVNRVDYTDTVIFDIFDCCSYYYHHTGDIFRISVSEDIKSLKLI